MDILELKKIIKEIVQSEIVPEPRGAGQQGHNNGMGIWYSDKGTMYREKEEKFPYLWHIKSKESTKKDKNTQEPKVNIPKAEEPKVDTTQDKQPPKEIKNKTKK